MGRKAISLAIGVALAGAVASGAAAQNLDEFELAAAVALPVITGGHPSTRVFTSKGDVIIDDNSAISLLTITNGRSSTTVLKIDVISGDPSVPGVGGDLWRSDSFDCLLTGRETVTFLVVPAGNGSIVYGECSTTLAPNPILGQQNIRQPTFTANGIFFAAAADPAPPGSPPPAISQDVLLADAVVIDLSKGQAYSFGAIPFQAGAGGGNDGNKEYRFNDGEYARWPAAVATSFIAPDSDPGQRRISAELILFTLDGTANTPPRISVQGLGYNDDEIPFDFGYAFDCFDIVSLDDLSLNFRQPFLGSLSGHLILLAQAVGSGSNDVHDSTYGDANNSRRRPVHGWIVQSVDPGQNVVLPGQPTALPEPPGQGSYYAVPGYVAWGRPLSQGVTPLAPLLGDQDPVFKAGP
jgi:hypothetical protein